MKWKLPWSMVLCMGEWKREVKGEESSDIRVKISWINDTHWHDIGSLLHEGAHREPKCIRQYPLVFQFLRLFLTGVGSLPLAR